MGEDSGRRYSSPIPYEAARINAAAVYCSDGRIGDHMDEFLHKGLGLPRYDRVACPGGPAALAGRLLAFWESRGVLDQLRFLVHVHDVRQVVLVAHAGCAYYQERLGVAPDAIEAEQRADLQRGASAVERIDAQLEVAAFFAHLDGSAVEYEPVFLPETMRRRFELLPANPKASAHPVPAPPTPTSPLRIRLPGLAEAVSVGPAPAARAERGRPAPDPRPAPRTARK